MRFCALFIIPWFFSCVHGTPLTRNEVKIIKKERWNYQKVVKKYGKPQVEMGHPNICKGKPGISIAYNAEWVETASTNRHELVHIIFDEDDNFCEISKLSGTNRGF